MSCDGRSCANRDISSLPPGRICWNACRRSANMPHCSRTFVHQRNSSMTHVRPDAQSRRSEERRVGKERRSWYSTYHHKVIVRTCASPTRDTSSQNIRLVTLRQQETCREIGHGRDVMRWPLLCKSRHFVSATWPHMLECSQTFSEHAPPQQNIRASTQQQHDACAT